MSTQIKKLKDENDFNQRQKNQDIRKEIIDYEAEIIRLNKIINNRDEELTHIRQKLEDHESMVNQYQQQIKFLQNYWILFYYSLRSPPCVPF